MVRRQGGRNRSFGVEVGGINRFHLKQFPSGARSWFERERTIQTSGSPLVVAPAMADPFDLIMVSPAAGQSWWSLLARGDHIGNLPPVVQNDLELSPAIIELGESPVPPIDRWLKLRTEGLSTAQRRLVAAMVRSTGNARAMNLCRKWSDPSLSGAIHGDMKAEHLLLDDSGHLRIVDWENAGRGPILWDRACLVQSILGQVILGIATFGDHHARALQLAIGDADDPDLACWLGLRLWQASVEWSSEQARSTSPAARMFLLGEKLLVDPASFRSLSFLNG